jgi:ABC-type phosphate/phosphonate transport system ATPase subunit
MRMMKVLRQMVQIGILYVVEIHRVAMLATYCAQCFGVDQ